MNPNITKALLGVVTAVTAATVLSKMFKESNITSFSDILKDVTIDLDAFTPKEEKVINPNGEDLTVKPEYVRIDEAYEDCDQSPEAPNRSRATF